MTINEKLNELDIYFNDEYNAGELGLGWAFKYITAIRKHIKEQDAIIAELASIVSWETAVTAESAIERAKAAIEKAEVTDE